GQRRRLLGRGVGDVESAVDTATAAGEVDLRGHAFPDSDADVPGAGERLHRAGRRVVDHDLPACGAYPYRSGDLTESHVTAAAVHGDRPVRRGDVDFTATGAHGGGVDHAVQCHVPRSGADVRASAHPSDHDGRKSRPGPQV